MDVEHDMLHRGKKRKEKSTLAKRACALRKGVLHKLGQRKKRRGSTDQSGPGLSSARCHLQKLQLQLISVCFLICPWRASLLHNVTASDVQGVEEKKESPTSRVQLAKRPCALGKVP
eukprot:1136373-Pelagomonas_calceolata.AAC.1